MRDLYRTITDRIIAELEQGVRPWHKPWDAGHVAGPITRPLRANGQAYNGINIVMLWLTALERGYAAPIWMTYRQASALGGHVRKGERGTLVVYANCIQRTETDPNTGEEQEREIPFLKGYTVFSVEQIDGLPAHFYALHAPRLNPRERNAHAEAFFRATGAEIHHGGNQACYSPSQDIVRMPPFESFRDAESYYGTLAHELTHWTRHPTRLDRDLGRKRWGDEGYGMEELTAELGAAFLCADLELEPQIREDHAPYIAGWLKVLKADSKAIFTAAAHAQRATNFLHGLQPRALDEAAA